MDILELIQQDHRSVTLLFKAIEGEHDFRNLYDRFSELYKELNLHAQAEAAVFYPALQNCASSEGVLQEADAEHEAISQLLEHMKDLSPTDPEFKATLQQVHGQVQQHVAKEESVLFELARRDIATGDRQTLGKEFQTVKRQRQSEVKLSLVQ